MAELLLVRHAQSSVNVKDLAFGNRGAPLTTLGLEVQVPSLVYSLITDHGIIPEKYERPVLASTYERPFQTALRAGFKEIHRSDLIDESEIYGLGPLAGIDIVKKHVAEDGWLPDEEIERAQAFLKAVKSGKLPYEIVFSHGMVIAAIVSELNKQGARYPFDPKRGYIPKQAQIVPVTI